MKKRVLILVNHEIVIYNFRRELVERLLAENCEVFISSAPGPKLDVLRDMGCIILETEIERHGVNPLVEIKLLWNYISMMKKIKPDVVLTYTIKPNIYGAFACRLQNIPCIANITGLGTAVENTNMMSKLTLFMYKIAFKNINTIFFQNTENMNLFRNNGISTDAHKLLPGSGVNLTHFSLLDYPTDETVKFVFISRIMQEKGINEYLEAAEEVTSQNKNVEFHICGFLEDDYSEIIASAVNRHVIKYHGMVEDIRDILKITHCTIHPTFYPEGLSNVLLESAASGRPIIATNRSGTRETLDDGENGYFVESENAKDLIRVINRFLELPFDKKKEMGLCGRKKVVKEFDRQIVVDKYIENIEEVTNGI